MLLPDQKFAVARAFAGRRQALKLIGGGSLSFCLPWFLSTKSACAAGASPRPSRINSCILIFYYGGPSHLDTYDMKPEAPAEVRGLFAGINSTAPGVRVCEHLPQTSRLMHKLAVVRSFHHPMRNHNSAAVEALCGRTPIKGDLELLANDPTIDFPCYGAALSRLAPPEQTVPAHVALPHVMYNVVMLPGQTAGFLGPAYAPFQIAKDPNAADFGVGELELPGELSAARLDQRRNLLHAVGRYGSETEATRSMDAYQARAFNLLQSEEVRRAFDLAAEPQPARDRYGRNKLGQSMLLARRLVEAGVKFINVNDKVRNGQLANWDSHQDNFPRLKDDLLPPADQAFSALIEDLDLRGLLDTTLVVALGEFGRTPRINASGGRDHWPDCFSVLLAGGGVSGGAVYGASDKLGAYPDRDPVTPGDLAATIFAAFGIDPAIEIHDALGRPFRIAEGRPLRGLFGGQI